MGRESVVIDCRTVHDSYFADPDDCRMFYHCSDWAGLEHKSCGSLYFHPQKRVCDWPYLVRRVRNDCPPEQVSIDVSRRRVNCTVALIDEEVTHWTCQLDRVMETAGC